MKPPVQYDRDRDGSVLKIDLADAIERLSADDRMKIAADLAFDEALVTRVLQHALEGATDDGDWFGADALHRIRAVIFESIGGVYKSEIETYARAAVCSAAVKDWYGNRLYELVAILRSATARDDAGRYYVHPVTGVRCNLRDNVFETVAPLSVYGVPSEARDDLIRALGGIAEPVPPPPADHPDLDDSAVGAPGEGGGS